MEKEKCQKCGTDMHQIGPFAKGMGEGESAEKWDGFLEFECINHPSVLERPSPQGQSSMQPNFEEVTTYLAIWTSEGTTERTRLPVKIRRARGAEPYLSCRDINPATQQRPAPPTLRTTPPPPPPHGDIRH
jgi:hypothetical protein